MPSSSTLTVTWPPSLAVETVSRPCRPSGMAWQAFKIKFKNTWPKRDAGNATSGVSQKSVITRQRPDISCSAMRTDDAKVVVTSTDTTGSAPACENSFTSATICRNSSRV